MMQTDELKRVEEGKAELKRIRREISGRRDAIRLQKIDEALADFAKFFIDREFEVEPISLPGEKRVTATFENLSAEISIDNLLDTQYKGTTFRFDLVTAMPEKAEYYVVLHAVTSEANPQISKEWEPTEAEVNAAIEREAACLKNLPNEEWFYTLAQDEACSIDGPDACNFPSMYKVLEHLAQ